MFNDVISEILLLMRSCGKILYSRAGHIW